MAMRIGRQGYLGLGIQSAANTPAAASVTFPFTANTVKGMHTPIDDMSARASRLEDFTSVPGKKWSEGDVDFNVDIHLFGWMLKLTEGNESLNTVGAGVYDHVFYTTVSGNDPLFATLYNYQGVDVQRFVDSAIDKLDLSVSDDMMTGKVTFKGKFPTTSAYTPTTISGTLLTFAKYSIQLGANLPAAAASSAIAIKEFDVSIQNNAEVIHESGTGLATRIMWKQKKVTGSFMRYFETVEDRDAYYNLDKKALIMTASGLAIGSSVEQFKINFAKIAYKDQEIETGLNDFFAIKTSFTAEWDTVQNRFVDYILRNARSSLYE